MQEYETSHPDQGRWESHYRYMDIQYMISGEERMGYANKGHMSVHLVFSHLMMSICLRS
ncbi:YhcH/YjgK/YiaL family protein [Paenibacillus sp. FA6]|uniref:YhcH/YjgK/YiaL family protein n=1 Tax=Paenibacillus sp. FA6 TaxID=3413029 RepID=UPI003F65A356